MEQMLERSLPLLAGRGIWVFAIALFVFAVMMVARLGRGRRFRVPATWGRRFGSFAFLLVAFVAAGLMLLMVGPMAPILAQVRHVQGGIGKPAPELAFREVGSDAARRLSETQGKVVVLNFWATWCPPCRAEMPALNRLQKEYEARGLAVVTISNEERAALLKYAVAQPLATLSGYTPELGWYAVDGRPLTLVLDRTGTIRTMMIGGQTDESFRRAVEPYLGS